MQLSLCLGFLQQSLDWTGLKCLEVAIATTIQLLCLFAYLSIMAGFLNDYGACLQQDTVLHK